MPLPKNRSSKYRVLSRKSAKGETRRVFVRRKSVKASCAVCKSALAGVSTGSRTEKSVSRKFGGHLCHSCTVRVIRDAARVKDKAKRMEDVDLIYKKYVEQLVK